MDLKLQIENTHFGIWNFFLRFGLPNLPLSSLFCITKFCGKHPLNLKTQLFFFIADRNRTMVLQSQFYIFETETRIQMIFEFEQQNRNNFFAWFPNRNHFKIICLKKLLSSMNDLSGISFFRQLFGWIREFLFCVFRNSFGQKQRSNLFCTCFAENQKSVFEFKQKEYATGW